MKKHTNIYLDYFGFNDTDFVPCEVCGKPATDIHHIEARGMGGSKTKDNIENLQALCRTCHIEYGDISYLKDMLKKIHKKYMQIYGTK